MSRTVIGSTLEVEGEVHGAEELIVQGRLKGAVVDGKAVIIEKSAQVEAQINAATVRVSGGLDGRVEATERVEIDADGRMNGDIKAPRISIAEGARYKGHIDTEQ